MKSVAPSTRFLSPRPVALTARSSRGPVGRSQLVIEAKTVWQLAPKSGKTLEALTLTDDINTQKSFVSVGDKKHQDAEQVLALPRILLYTFKIGYHHALQYCLLPQRQHITFVINSDVR